MDHFYIGIDNGLKGGVVVIDQDLNVVEKILTPTFTGKKTEYDVVEMANTLRHYSTLESPVLVALEKAQAMPGQGVVSMFSTGRGYGLWEGILATLGLSYIVVHPRTWQKEILKDLNKDVKKQAAVLFAQRMQPKEDWRATPRSKNVHDGFTDAYAMAVYASRMGVSS